MSEYKITYVKPDRHPKLKQAFSTVEGLAKTLRSFMDRELVSGEILYEGETGQFMADVSEALKVYNAASETTVAETLSEEQALAVYTEKTELDKEISDLEANPEIKDLNIVPQYRQMKVRQHDLNTIKVALEAAGWTPRT